ncbi:hypothetical protein TGAM01_v208179, partial [Trichoderma gamsii]
GRSRNRANSNSKSSIGRNISHNLVNHPRG